MGDLAELIAKVEKASGPSREIDARLWCSMSGYDWRGGDSFNPSTVFWLDQGRRGNAPVRNIAQYTASLDAVVALVEKELPGWACGFDGGPKTKIAFVDPRDFADRFLGARFTAEGPTPALALLLALLRAKQAEEET